LTYTSDISIFNQPRLCINIVKLFNDEINGNFIAFGRVISGTVQEG